MTTACQQHSASFRPIRLAAALLFLAALPFSASAQELIEGTTADGATYSVPAQWVAGETLSVSGAGWTNSRGNRGSIIAVVYDRGGVPSPDPENDEIWLRITAKTDGSWSAELPFPPDAGWKAGETHLVHFLSGSLGRQDKARGPAVEVTIIEE